MHQIEGLPAGWATFAGESMLEAALIHTRCVAEFLRRSDEPGDSITARDYVPGWHWTDGEGLKNDLAEIHGRVAHLGLIRRCNARARTSPGSRSSSATPCRRFLGGFREFLGRLETELVERFYQPTPDVERTDLAAAITALIGPAGGQPD